MLEAYEGTKTYYKDSHILTIIKEGEKLGGVEMKDNVFWTYGQIGENGFESFIELLRGLQGHGLMLDDLYF